MARQGKETACLLWSESRKQSLQETSVGVHFHENMRKLMANTSPDNRNNLVIAGLKFNLQYLGCYEELEFGGTDHEVANVMHDIHILYGKRSRKLRKARNVIVFINSERIDILDEYEDEILLGFFLVHVKAVTTCVGQGPYSKTCVLVAKRYNEPLYKAFVFFFKTAALAGEFHHFTNIAFQIGFKEMEKKTLKSSATADEEMPSNASSLDRALHEGERSRRGNENDEIFSPDDKECDVFDEVGKNASEMQNLLSSDSEFGQLKNKDEWRVSKSSMQDKTVTVQLSNSGNFYETREKQKLKFNLSLGDENNNLNPSKLKLFMDTVGQTRSVPIPNWFRNSYRKFRKMSSNHPQSYGTTSA